ncbi:MAG: hypothetical protein DRG82_09135 [Deltaproteobacteria bacterium]|nr:MAG: hypothetical protein DRG82_09135 [Deltaproteobacteria bacterium]
MATINLRDLPSDLHRKAKAQAALEGITLKALFIISLLTEYLKRKGVKDGRHREAKEKREGPAMVGLCIPQWEKNIEASW